MGGVRNLASYATEGTISFLAKRRVRLWFVIDRDEQDDAEVQRLMSSLGERAKTFVLAKRELENYLVVPRPVCEFIKVKRQLANSNDKTDPSIADVENAINDCVDRLKATAIERRVIKNFSLPLYPNRKRLLDTTKGLEERIKVEITAWRETLDKSETDLEQTIADTQNKIDQSWSLIRTDIATRTDISFLRAIVSLSQTAKDASFGSRSLRV